MCLESETIDNIADPTQKNQQKLRNFIYWTPQVKSDEDRIWMTSELEEVSCKRTPQHERLVLKMSAKEERKTRCLWTAA